MPDSFKPFSLGLLDKLSIDEMDLLADEEAQLRENYLVMIQFLAAFALVCRQDVRNPGVLKLFIGEDIFAFYLLLWEIGFQADRD